MGQIVQGSHPRATKDANMPYKIVGASHLALEKSAMDYAHISSKNIDCPASKFIE